MKNKISKETIDLINEALRKQLLEGGVDLMKLIPDKVKLLEAIKKAEEEHE